MFSCEFYENSNNTFSCRTPPVAAAVRSDNKNVNILNRYAEKGKGSLPFFMTTYFSLANQNMSPRASLKPLKHNFCQKQTDLSRDIITKEIDMKIITETKPDDSFQFLNSVYSPVNSLFLYSLQT